MEGNEGNILSRSLLSLSLIIITLFVLFSSNLPLSASHQIVLADWASPTQQTLYSVYMVSATDGWAVGAGGTMIHWDGLKWSNVASPTGFDLDSVFFVNAQNGWAVGAYGTIIQWNGTSWKRVAGPTTADLSSVRMVNTWDGWAVGKTVQNIVSGNETWVWTIIRWNGSSWTNSTTPSEIGNNLLSVTMVDSVDGWAVGAGGSILRWNGTQWSVWTEFPMPGSIFAGFYSVCLVNAYDGWAVGDLGTVYHWDGRVWAGFPTWGSTDNYLSVFFVNADDGWIAGGTGGVYEIGSSGPVNHWNGTMWTSVDNPSINPVALRSVFMVDANDGWIVGDGGLIMRWSGVEWTVPEYPTPLSYALILSLTLTTVALARRTPRKRIFSMTRRKLPEARAKSPGDFRKL
jgi:photosystem II stability/assembly factor-like uncharacterized protein